MKKEPEKKDIAKAYGKYAKQFTPKPKYFLNCLRAFGTGGAICALALRYQNFLTDNGIPQEDAGIFVTLTLIAAAQILTGIGVFACDSQIRRSRGHSTYNRICQFNGGSGTGI